MNPKVFKMFGTTLSFIILAVSPVFAAPVMTKRASNDLLVMQFADVLEQLESGFYSQALSKFQDSDFTDAGFLSSQIPLEQLASIQGDEQTHSTALQAAIKDFGGTPITSCKFNFDAALHDVTTMAEVARVIENVGVGAYLGAAHLISDPVLLTMAGSILTAEARHQTVLNILSGSGTAIPAAFDIALRPEEVLGMAIPFFSGPCDLGIKPNPTLTITNRDPVRPGTLLTFQSTAMNNKQQSQLFCQMIASGMPVAMVLPLPQCVVPGGINGPVLIFITSDNQMLANDAVNRTPNNLVAGPTMTFIDTEFQQLSQLVLGGKDNGGSGASGSGGDDSSTLTRTVDPAIATSIMDGAMGSATATTSDVAATATAATPSVTTTGTDSSSITFPSNLPLATPFEFPSASLSDTPAASSSDSTSGATPTASFAPNIGGSSTPTISSGSSGVTPTASFAPNIGGSSTPTISGESSGATPTASFAPNIGGSGTLATTTIPTGSLNPSSSPSPTPSTMGGFVGAQNGPNHFTGTMPGGISVDGWQNVPMPSS